MEAGMRLLRHFNRHGSSVLFLGTVFLLAASACGQLRIVSFNTANNGDNGSNISPRAGMDVVLEAIGDELVNGIARPIDILALQEQRSAASTTQQIVDLLNGIYGAGTYDRGTVNPNTFGGGRVGVIYNTQTVELLGQTPVSNTSSNGAARQPMRYQFRPVGYGAQADFYVYSNHYKASTGATNESRRDVEATAVRANADALGQGAHIIFAGDYNIQTSSEAMYQTLLSSGNGQAFDPINTPGNWHNSSALRHTHTQSPYNPSNNIPELISGGLDDRFDFQLVSAEFLDSDGLAYIPGSYHAFGNNGSHSLNDYIDDSSNTALPHQCSGRVVGRQRSSSCGRGLPAAGQDGSCGRQCSDACARRGAVRPVHSRHECGRCHDHQWSRYAELHGDHQRRPEWYDPGF